MHEPLKLINYSNPFNPETTIKFHLPHQGRIRLDIFNIKGQLVTTLCDDLLPAGEHSLVWNGLDKSGREMSSGVFFSRVTTLKKTLFKRCCS